MSEEEIDATIPSSPNETVLSDVSAPELSPPAEAYEEAGVSPPTGSSSSSSSSEGVSSSSSSKGKEKATDEDDEGMMGEADEDIDLPEKNLDRSKWLATAMRKHPEILELHERLRPFSGQESFGRQVNAGKTEVKEVLSRDIVIQLLMSYLEKEGLQNTVAAIEEEAKVAYNPPPFVTETPLVTLLRMGIKDREKMFEIDEEEDQSADPEVVAQYEQFGSQEDDDEKDVPGFDINIYDEEEDNDDNIVEVKSMSGGSESTQILAATFNKLVQRLTSEKSHDMRYMRTFLATYQSFTTPEKLLTKLIQRYHVPFVEGMDEDEFKNGMQRTIQLRVCNVLKNWIERHFGDFNEKMISTINSFVDNTLAREGNAALGRQLRSAITRKQDTKGVGSGTAVIQIEGAEPAPEPKVPKNIFSPSLALADIDEEEVARQLSILEFKYFERVETSEFLNESWENQRLKHRAPNLIFILEYGRNFTNWIALQILESMKGSKGKAKLYSKFLKIADLLLQNYRNLATARNIYNALTHSTVMGVVNINDLSRKDKETWNDLDSLFANEGQTSEYKNFSINMEPPAIPALPVALNELTEIEEKHPDFTNQLINFEKRRLIYVIINFVSQYQQREYHLHPVYQIQKVLKEAPEVTGITLDQTAEEILKGA